jgi:tRNA modification GTPase
VLGSLLGAGARLARPGEFTYRAFLNGRLDLVQAAAVDDLITADSMYQAELALQHLGGKLSHHLQELRERFIELISLLEGNIDFSEEQHYNFIDRPQAISKMDAISIAIRNLTGTFDQGRMIRDGFHVAIVGKPNVGKSSIFNALMGESRAIVTPIAGTTRDYLRERIRVGNFVMQLIDTAGVHTSTEEIEQEGIRRSLEVIENADLILFVVDGSAPLESADLELWEQIEAKDCMVLLNKSDLKSATPLQLGRDVPQFVVSAVTREGLASVMEALRIHIENRVRYNKEQYFISNVRHRECLDSALSSVDRAMQSLIAGMSEEYAMVDLHQALQKIGEITGEVTIEDIYQHIFTNFCIGK